MFSTVRFFIKTSLVFLGIGLATGLFMIVLRDVFERPYGYELISAHAHVILVGSVMMMIMGVALWFFPRPEKGDATYSPARILVAYWILTLGTAVRFTAQVILAFIPSPALRLVAVVAAFAQVLAIVLFFHANWKRIRPLGSAKREAEGERF